MGGVSLTECRRCGSPFLRRCPEWRVVRCVSCAYLHVLDTLGEFVDGAVPAGPVLVSGPVDGAPGLVRVHRFTARRVCEWVARRRDIGVQESLTG